MPPFHDDRSPAQVIFGGIKQLVFGLWWLVTGPGWRLAVAVASSFWHRFRGNLQRRRLFSLPNLLVLFWVVLLLWGERWVFDSKVAECSWRNWEKWPKGAKPHHLVFVADPQVIDPHSYPSRPWPLSSLTLVVTDNYLRRGYGALVNQLNPDSIFFLGDLFDGGREWKTSHGKFVDPALGNQRSAEEKRWLSTWNRRYGEDYWLQEYMRFGSIFFNPWKAGKDAPGSWQRGKKLVASLPGNHDLGFGAQIQLSVRERFSAYFGDVNRIDVVGNHTIVTVDTVSLSADTSAYKTTYDLEPIYGPVNEFLDGVKDAKRRAVQDELSLWYGLDRKMQFRHGVDDLKDANLDDFPQPQPSPGAADFPTILLSHVPLYRGPGTPCGPYREHWPPAKPPPGQTEPVRPDHRNAISVVAGYQYQNVLNEEDSVKLVKRVGNVIHAFSGDDHDYCEITHSESQESIKEITVKSLSMAMGVPTPGFVMASLYNPVDELGKPIPGSPETTLQTHLCLLPNQIHTYTKYVSFIFVTIVLLALRAVLVAAFDWTPFAHDRHVGTGISLPLFKDKAEPPELSAKRDYTSSAGTSSNYLSARVSTTSTRSRDSSITNGSDSRWQSKRKRGRDSYDRNGGPRISLDDGVYHTSSVGRRARGTSVLPVAAREMGAMTWRVAWMALLFLVYLTRKG